jgi:hypothetical protein
MTSNAYVYVHNRLDNGQPFYVGKGSGNRATSRKGRNQYWERIAKKVGFQSVILQSGLTHCQALNAEKFVIAALRKRYQLTNVTDGGDGGNGLKGVDHPLHGKPRSAETRAKISKALKGVSTGGKGKKRIKLTEEHKEAISKGLTGKTKSPEHIKNASEAFKRSVALNPIKRGPRSEETKRKLSLAHTGMSKPMKPRFEYKTPLGTFGTLHEAAAAHGLKSITHKFHGSSGRGYSYPPEEGYIVTKKVK